MEKSEIRVLSDLVYELRQDIAKLRERVAVLESRTIHQHAQPVWTAPGPAGPPWNPTCSQTGMAGF